MQARPTLPRETFDPFGERVEARPTTTDMSDRRARNAALAVFWIAALFLTAGRVYYRDVLPMNGSPTVNLAAASTVLASTGP